MAYSALMLLVKRVCVRACVDGGPLPRCWCRYLSGTRCRLFVYSPADVTASQNSVTLASFKFRLTGFTFLVPAYLGCLGKEAVKQM